ncbi:hypothetical protein AB0F77_32585 [Streptomyces sp. NPDC026672]|uniref:hypothetical protein n=1 Tax=unclassified Streptomyces TaxID=2593676 RepID=UPI0034090FC8
MPGRSSARPTALPHTRLRSFGGTPTARGLAAAVLAVAALVMAANVVPAHAEQPPRTTQQAPR